MAQQTSAHNDPNDPRNPNNRLHLNFNYGERNFTADAARAYPTTPSTFPQPVFPDPRTGQPEVWGAQQQTPSTNFGGPPSYFMQSVQYQAPGQYANGNTGAAPAAPAARNYNDGTTGLVHQFSHQNLGASPLPTPRSQSPYARNAPIPRPRTAGNQGTSAQQYASSTPAPAMPSAYDAGQEKLPPRDREKYSDNVYKRTKISTEMVGSFFKDSVQRARDRNQRAKELDVACQELDERRRTEKITNLRRGEASYLRFLRTKERPENFQTLKVIGKGAFGEVRLVSRKDNNRIYALKSLVKTEMFKRDQLAHVRSERDILAESDSPWVVKLHTTFQDNVFLYMLMEFLPGGDLMTMLIKYEIFTEDITRFYMAELTLAIEAVHKLGFIHRDVKPDNILLDRGGHIKLTDFGLSTGFHKEHDQSYYANLMAGKSKNRDNRNSVSIDQIQLTVSNRPQINTWRKSRRQLAYSTVGTPDYIAPEIFTGKGYDYGCDWWSVGTIMFECLIGWPPFCAEESTETYRKIVDWPRHLHFPPDQRLNAEPESFIRKSVYRERPWFQSIVANFLALVSSVTPPTGWAGTAAPKRSRSILSSMALTGPCSAGSGHPLSLS